MGVYNIMIIFLRTQVTGTPLEIDENDTLEALCRKANERMGREGVLVFSGKQINPSSEQTVSDIHITKECTLHFMQKKDSKLKLNITFQGITQVISIEKESNIKKLKQEIANIFPSSLNESKLPSIFCDSKELYDNRKIGQVLQNNSFVSVVKIVNRNSDINYDRHINDEKKEDILANFANSASSSNVEIVFCFDTTGSMGSCIAEVRKKLDETVERLLKDIPNIRIGIMAVGDYCDSLSTYVVTYCDLSSDLKALKDFVNKTGTTGGGDAPEAYELALRTASRDISWTEGYSKALVMIGDEVPHPPSYTTEKINWFDELDDLASKDIKVYGVRALNSSHSIPFYEEMAERTGAISIHFSSFHLIVDMFLAICYRESSPEQLENFEKEITNDGKMEGEMKTIFESLAKPNYEKKETKKEKPEETKPLKSREFWYDLSNDKSRNPSYKYDNKSNKWIQYNSGYSSNYRTSSLTSPTSSYPRSSPAPAPSEKTGWFSGFMKNLGFSS